MEFNLPKEENSIIKVIGVGGGGGNAVNHMYNQGIKGVDFIVCNTDKQALDVSPVPYKIQLGPSLTEGRGAGSIPEIGMNAATENIDEIKNLLSNGTKMVFVTAGMGGGTGTGAAPVIARIAKELGILTVGIVTVPFNFEGRKRRQQAQDGLDNMRDSVDTLLVINNERLREISGNLSLGQAFAQADDVLTIAAKGIAEVISVTGAINVDFNDVNTVMKDSGNAIMGSAQASGETRALDAVKEALSSPLLNDNDIAGAKYVLLNITYGDQEVLMDEISEITDYIQDEAGSTADVIWGHGYDENLGDALSVTIIATGFTQAPITGYEKAPERIVQKLEVENTREVTNSLTSPTNSSASATQEELFVKKTIEPSNEEKAEEEEAKATTVNWELTAAVESKEMEEETKEDVSSTTDSEEATQKEDLSTVEMTESSEEKQDAKEEAPERIVHILDDEDDSSKNVRVATEQDLSPEERQKRQNDRLERLHRATKQIQSPEGLSELEREPAYKRRSIHLDDIPHSSESTQSRFEVSQKDDKTSFRGTNSFLHDNVD